jgi:hypothetical protein
MGHIEDLIDECIDEIKHQHYVSTDKAIDMLLDIRVACSSTIERTNEGENELQEELVALVGADPGISESADSPALTQE